MRVPKTASTWMVGTGSGLGTCGELVQGVLGDGRHFHVTCPIEKKSTVSLRARPSAEWSIEAPRGAHEKLIRAIELTASHLNLGPLRVRLERWSDLDVGKGMGSSTADIVAGARALANAAGEVLSERELAHIATAIEPSDGSMFDGMVAFQQRGEFVVRAYPWWPQFAIVMAIPPNTFSTELANFAGKEEYASEYDRMMAELNAASDARRGDVFAAVATQSAQLNQYFVPNPWFGVLLQESEYLGADGVIVGHTGTVSGLLFLLADGERGIGLAAEVIDGPGRAMVHLENILPANVRLELTTTAPYLDRAT